MLNDLSYDESLAEGQLVKLVVAEPYVPAPKPEPGEGEEESAASPGSERRRPGPR